MARCPTVRDSFWVFCLRAPAFRHKFPSRAAWWMKTGRASPERAWNCGRRGRRSRGASSDLAGNFRLNLPAAGEYAIRAERLGFYLYQGQRAAV